MKPSLTQWVAQQRQALGLGATARSIPLTAEASHRRFYRLLAPGCASVIAMDSPPALERNQAFVDLASVFAEAGLPVPKVLAADLEQGFLLMSDVGERDLYAAYEAGETDAALAEALSALLKLQSVQSQHIADYDRARFTDELDLFRQWFVRRFVARPSVSAPSTPFPEQPMQAVFAQLIDSAMAQPKVCVHRDYHCRNLLFSAQGELGIVDFQDALRGPYTYDLASLLHDCYYALPEQNIDAHREWTRNQIAASTSAVEFRRQVEWMAVQRQLKAVGIFVRLLLRDNKPSHLKHIQPTLSQTARLCGRYAALRPLGSWLEQQLVNLPDQVQALQHEAQQR